MRISALLFCILFITIFSFAAEDVKPQRIKPGPGQESVWDYPRPPRVEKTSKKIRVLYDGVVIAETDRAVRVLETGHAPVYYIPREDIHMEHMTPSTKSSKCEWKGTAVYFNIKGRTKENQNAAWSYPEPTRGYEMIRNHLAFYPKLMDACFVNGERVVPQPGEYYGGWITNEIVGPFAGE
ncbi:DUF427 domain-containing protein [bacterium]|nr:DUF427 domain-containing protein [bacterium]MCI0603558.1 DUF427 domain-containing protein [bacterium]